MKKVAILFLFVLCYAYTNASDFLNRDFAWDVSLSLEDGIEQRQTIRIGADTLIDGKTYWLVNNFFPLRQCSDSILFYDATSKEEVLLYNFALQVGDSLELPAIEFMGLPKRYAKVIKVDTILLNNGENARRIEFEPIYPRHIDIEFVGDAERGLLGPLDNMFKESRLNAFYKGGECLYPALTSPLLSLCDQWNILEHFDYGVSHRYHTTAQRLSTDTVIGATRYVKVEGGVYNNNGVVREGNNRDIYFIPSGSEHEYLLYAFNAKEGDNLTNLWIGGDPESCPNGYTATVKEITPGNPRMFTLTVETPLSSETGEDKTTWEVQWIEGVGMVSCPCGNICPAPLCEGDMGTEVLCAYKGGEQVYTSAMAEEVGCIYNYDPHEGLGDVQRDKEQCTKTFRDGHILIQRADKTYTLQGQEVK